MKVFSGVGLLSILMLSISMLRCSTPQHSEVVRPNIVVIVSDDQGWGDLSVNGNTNLHTPNIDRLAREGARFDRFYVSPVCSPTRAAFLTGRYHPRAGVHSTSEGGERMDLDETTIAQVFKEAGYVTAAFGKWHNGMQYPYHPNARGFDEFYGFCSGHWGNYFDPQLEHNGKLVKGNGFIVDDLTDHALRFMEKNKARPFFLYIPYNTPHSPMQVPDRWWDRFKGKELEMLSGDPNENMDFTRAALAMCENIDWNVGRLMEKLAALDLEDNTIVLYFSDNGPNSARWNGGMKGRKGSTDEGGIRSPLIMRWRGAIPAGKQVEEVSAAIDLLPTLPDLAGIAVQPRKPLDGVSLKPLLLEADAPWKERLIFSHWKGRVSVRNQRYRLDHQGNLYDMIADPGQSTNIAERQRDVTAMLSSAVKEWRADVLSGAGPDVRRFTVGDSIFAYTQLPARDARAHGNIVRSNKFPNDSYFTNWTSVDDKITWDVEVLFAGDYKVEVYYTCPAKDVGSTVALSFGSASIAGKVVAPHDPPVRGREHDRVARQESFVKDFIPMDLGTIHLEAGPGTLTLQAIDMPGARVMDFRLLMLTRMGE